MSGVSLETLAALKALWARVPDAGCKGLCAESCGPIGMSEVEAAVLIGGGHLRAEQLEPFGDGMWLLVGDGGVCPLLVEGRCSVYALRPAICRGFGSVAEPRMACPFGCVPAGGAMPVAEFAVVLRGVRADQGGGGDEP